MQYQYQKFSDYDIQGANYTQKIAEMGKYAEKKNTLFGCNCMCTCSQYLVYRIYTIYIISNYDFISDSVKNIA